MTQMTPEHELETATWQLQQLATAWDPTAEEWEDFIVRYSQNVRLDDDPMWTYALLPYLNAYTSGAEVAQALQDAHNTAAWALHHYHESQGGTGTDQATYGSDTESTGAYSDTDSEDGGWVQPEESQEDLNRRWEAYYLEHPEARPEYQGGDSSGEGSSGEGSSGEGSSGGSSSGDSSAQQQPVNDPTVAPDGLPALERVALIGPASGKSITKRLARDAFETLWSDCGGQPVDLDGLRAQLVLAPDQIPGISVVRRTDLEIGFSALVQKDVGTRCVEYNLAFAFTEQTAGAANKRILATLNRDDVVSFTQYNGAVVLDGADPEAYLLVRSVLGATTGTDAGSTVGQITCTGRGKYRVTTPVSGQDPEEVKTMLARMESSVGTSTGVTLDQDFLDRVNRRVLKEMVEGSSLRFYYDSGTGLVYMVPPVRQPGEEKDNHNHYVKAFETAGNNLGTVVMVRKGSGLKAGVIDVHMAQHDGVLASFQRVTDKTVTWNGQPTT